uniref:Uncharacterized protein n=1 Tax=Human herpesvirus 2 TaxID=10310 RepID=A0A2U9DVC2_HHV2|nr:hypothetical protein [Human alphaherpesvirus 2]QBH76153.1 hypothetical protein [Human alphaherpesvirus 2]QBH78514.1 hypothetical protein [Human alphaherpesvirus 2]QBH79304.1 hypothetical protein [Human alphaherpesvirus 2]QBH79920.1 hypothetical protein [Human alphaherpesvirus 2]
MMNTPTQTPCVSRTRMIPRRSTPSHRNRTCPPPTNHPAHWPPTTSSHHTRNLAPCPYRQMPSCRDATYEAPVVAPWRF